MSKEIKQDKKSISAASESYPENWRYLFPIELWDQSFEKLLLFFLKSFIINIIGITIIILSVVVFAAPLIVGIIISRCTKLGFIVFLSFLLQIAWGMCLIDFIFILFEILAYNFSSLYKAAKGLFHYKTIHEYIDFIQYLCRIDQNTSTICNSITSNMSPSMNKLIRGTGKGPRRGKYNRADFSSDIVFFRSVLQEKQKLQNLFLKKKEELIETAYLKEQKCDFVCGLAWWENCITIGHRQFHWTYKTDDSINVACEFYRRSYNRIPEKWMLYFQQYENEFPIFTKEPVDFSKNFTIYISDLGEYSAEEYFTNFISKISKLSNPRIHLVSFKTNLDFFQIILLGKEFEEQQDNIWGRNDNENKPVFHHIIIFEEVSTDEVHEYLFSKLKINEWPPSHTVSVLILFLKTSEEEFSTIIEENYNARMERETLRLQEEKKREEERKKKDEEIRIAKEEHENFVKRIHQAVRQWSKIKNIPSHSFIPYFPNKTLHTFIQQRAQEVVLDFKNGDSFVQEPFIKQLVSFLKTTFENDLTKMTFVCIPASNIRDNDKRYRYFSEKICETTGMQNAFEHIRIIESATSKHLGGTSAHLLYDSEYFNEKHIVLFDDIITSGNTISSMKQELERYGADVICAISFGITTQDSYYSDIKLKELIRPYDI
ncbi:MAG: phosphoribosyltransferase [Bacteroidales bacterium]|nr:phosphoribosyltransferase [Bacteroidales bacterium]